MHKSLLPFMFALLPVESFAQGVEPVATHAGAAITIPFSPPTDKPVTYRVKRHTEGKFPQPDSETRQIITYTRAELGSGYVMTIDTVEMSTATGVFKRGDMTLMAGRVRDAVALSAPVTVLIDQNGQPLRMEGWPQYIAALRASFDLQIAKVPQAGNREQASRAITMMLDQMASLPADGALLSAADPWISLLGYGGTTIKNGETLKSESHQSPFGGATVVTINENQAVVMPDGAIRLSRVQTTDREQFVAALREVSATGSQNLPAEIRQMAAADQQLLLETDRIADINILIEPDGSIRTASWQVRQEREGKVEQLNEVTIERLD